MSVYMTRCFLLHKYYIPFSFHHAQAYSQEEHFETKKNERYDFLCHVCGFDCRRRFY